MRKPSTFETHNIFEPDAHTHDVALMEGAVHSFAHGPLHDVARETIFGQDYLESDVITRQVCDLVYEKMDLRSLMTKMQKLCDMHTRSVIQLPESMTNDEWVAYIYGRSDVHAIVSSIVNQTLSMDEEHASAVTS